MPRSCYTLCLEHTCLQPSGLEVSAREREDIKEIYEKILKKKVHKSAPGERCEVSV